MFGGIAIAIPELVVFSGASPQLLREFQLRASIQMQEFRPADALQRNGGTWIQQKGHQPNWESHLRHHASRIPRVSQHQMGGRNEAVPRPLPDAFTREKFFRKRALGLISLCSEKPDDRHRQAAGERSRRIWVAKSLKKAFSNLSVVEDCSAARGERIDKFVRSHRLPRKQRLGLRRKHSSEDCRESVSRAHRLAAADFQETLLRLRTSCRAGIDHFPSGR